MKKYEPLTTEQFILQHGQEEFDAACEYWPCHGIYEPEVWLLEFSRWTQNDPHLLLDFAPEYTHGFLRKKVLPKCEGGWIRHLTHPQGITTETLNSVCDRNSFDFIPLSPDIQIRTDQGHQSRSNEYHSDGTLRLVPYKGQPILTKIPPRIVHCSLEDLKDGHGPDPYAWSVSKRAINAKEFPGQYKVSWTHSHERHPSQTPEEHAAWLQEHLLAHHGGRRDQDGNVVAETVNSEHRHGFLLLLNDMSNHLNKHTWRPYTPLNERSADFDHWSPQDHHGVPCYECHMIGDPGKYLMLPTRKTEGDPYLHSHHQCPAATLLTTETDLTPDITAALLDLCKSHSKPHKDPITGFINPGFRCAASKDLGWFYAHIDSAHRVQAQRCNAPILTKEQCNAPTQRRQRNKETGLMETITGTCRRYVTPDSPCQVRTSTGGTHGTEHSGSTRPCEAFWPCRTHTGPIGNYDTRRFDWDGMQGDSCYLPSTTLRGEGENGNGTWSLYVPQATLPVHAHQGIEVVDRDYPNPAERFHAPLLTRDRLLGHGTLGDPDYVKRASTVFLVAEGAHKAAAVAYYIWLHDLDATVLSVASVTLWAGVPEFDEVAALLEGRRVVIIGDNDWVLNPLVISQLEGLRQKLVNNYQIQEVLIAAPPTEGYGKLGVDDWLGILFPEGGLETLLVYRRTVPTAKITSDLRYDFLASRLASSRESDSLWWKIQALATTLAAMAGRLEIKGKTCNKEGCRTETGNPLTTPPVGHLPEGLENNTVAPPYSTLKSVLGWKSAATIDTFINYLVELDWMKEVTNSDPKFRYNSKNGEIEVEKTRYFEITNPDHHPNDCNECDAYWLEDWDGWTDLLPE